MTDEQKKQEEAQEALREDFNFETFEDEFLIEEKQLLDEFESFWDWYWTGVRLMFSQLGILFQFARGFLDHGKSAQEAVERLDSELHISFWISDITKDYLQQLFRDIYTNFDLLGAQQISFGYYGERVTHFIKNIQPFDLVQNFILYIITNFLEGGNGEFSLGNPLLTAYFPTFAGATLLLIQFTGNIVLNHWWAEGNLYLLTMQVFTFAQFYAMTQLMWDV